MQYIVDNHRKLMSGSTALRTLNSGSEGLGIGDMSGNGNIKYVFLPLTILSSCSAHLPLYCP